MNSKGQVKEHPSGKSISMNRTGNQVSKQGTGLSFAQPYLRVNNSCSSYLSSRVKCYFSIEK